MCGNSEPVSWVCWLVGWFFDVFVKTRLYRRWVQRLTSDNFYVLPHGQTMTSISTGHIIMTPTQPVRSGRQQRESNPGPSHQELRALPTELPRSHFDAGSISLPKVTSATVRDLCLFYSLGNHLREMQKVVKNMGQIITAKGCVQFFVNC